MNTSIKDETALILRSLAPLCLIILATRLYVALYLQVNLCKLTNCVLIDNPFSSELSPFHASELFCHVEDDILRGIFFFVVFKQEPCCTDVFRQWFL